MVRKHVQACKFCQEHNKQAVKYSKYNFEVEPAPMKFISMDLIGEFHPPSSKVNRYILPVPIPDHFWEFPTFNLFCQNIFIRIQ